ncbi:hypothetical protein [Teredinibacter waterburyi]|uniref:hypothetical protein n=1 Tax=Teredinibacter waterburyi TaxID=1500538 RepID=UPI00165EEE09|nr:hypothetical protein [Teredinibacter waterburyi]
MNIIKAVRNRMHSQSLTNHISTPKKLSLVAKLAALAGLLSFSFMAFNSTAMPKPETKVAAAPALEKVSSRYFDEYYLAKTADWPGLQRIHITEAEVSFDKRWLKEYRHTVSDSHRAKIAADYGDELKTQLARAFSNAGWKLLEEPADYAVILTPKLVDLYLNAPEPKASIDKSFVWQAGRVVMDLDFAANDKPLARIVDRDETRFQNAAPIEANRATNFRQFKVLMSKWSKKVVKQLALTRGEHP